MTEHFHGCGVCQKHVATMRLSPTLARNKRANTYILLAPFTLGYHPRTTPAGQNTEQLLFFFPPSTLRNRRARSDTTAVASRSIPQVHRQDQRRRAVKDSVGKVSRCLNDLMSKENAELKNTTTSSVVMLLFVLFPDALGLLRLSLNHKKKKAKNACSFHAPSSPQMPPHTDTSLQIFQVEFSRSWRVGRHCYLHYLAFTFGTYVVCVSTCI